jgi:hypothetical protein
VTHVVAVGGSDAGISGAMRTHEATNAGTFIADAYPTVAATSAPARDNGRRGRPR